ncbi:MAG: hypothetical protein JNN17_16850 [Verrucomicrobiaceae bacterium]|nr:hypothetical protein [Verrucomicrobiaceae bacterium]
MKKQVHFVWLEGVLEEAAARKILACTGFDVEGAVFKVAGSNSTFWQRIKDRNASAEAGLVVVGFADLEQDPCAVGLIRKHLPHGVAPGFVLRIAVRMLESWLMADAEKMAAFLHAPISKLPANPDEIDHPKRELVNLARRHSNRRVQEDMVPEAGHTGIVGKGYRTQMENYIEKHWRPRAAAKRSESLRRALAALENLARS